MADVADSGTNSTVDIDTKNLQANDTDKPCSKWIKLEEYL